jgi:hypothetical protein
MLIKVKTTEMATSDLEKYYHALNKYVSSFSRGCVSLCCSCCSLTGTHRALMKYHQVKMEEINKILRELWQHTYKGQDIDTIEIRADVDTTKDGGKSSYNYRVTSSSSFPPLPPPTCIASPETLILTLACTTPAGNHGQGRHRARHARQVQCGPKGAGLARHPPRASRDLLSQLRHPCLGRAHNQP